MDKLLAELQRLYFLPNQQWQFVGDGRNPATPGQIGDLSPVGASRRTGYDNALLDLLSPEGRARAMVMSFERATDWGHAAALSQAVQEDLDWPAPAVAVSGGNGYQLWFSLSEAAPVAQLQSALRGLRARYLSEIPADRIRLLPGATESAGGASRLVERVPGLNGATGKWSAFIDPDMGGLFAGEPWLEMAPNPDKQADLLARFKSIGMDDFQSALKVLGRTEHVNRPGLEPATAAGGKAFAAPAAGQQSALNAARDFTDPKAFLLTVMNDPSTEARLRIEAAIALLPYFHGGSA